MSPPILRAVPVTVVSLTGLTVAFIATSSGAQEVPRPDTSNWKCESCPFAKGYEANYELGGSYLSDDAARFGNGTGYDEEGGYVVAGGEGKSTSDTYQLQWELEDLGLDSRSIEIEGGQAGTYEYRVGYSELPYRRYDTTQTVFQHASDELLVLPAGWVPAGTTAGFTALNANLADRNIEIDRQTVDVGGGYRGIDGLRVEADYRHTERDGWGIRGAPFYTNSSLLAVPLDDSTDTASVAATYSGANWSTSLSWIGSFYDNSNREWDWDNPYTGGGRGRLAQAPDNDAQTVALEGAYRMPAETTVSVSAAFGSIRQDESLLPYTSNPGLPVRPLPRGSLDAKVDTRHWDLGVTSRPWSFLRLKGLYRYDDRDNRTDVAQWTRTITDLFDSGAAEPNRPYSFKRNSLQLSAAARFTRYDWLKPFEFEAGYDRVDVERNLQEVTDGTEESGWGMVRWRPGSLGEVTVRGGIARRDPDSYDLTVAQANGQNPLLRKYTLAYRFRDFAKLNARIGWPGRPIQFGAELYYSTTDYTESPLGLRKFDDRRYAADVTWAINDKTSLYVQGGYEDQALGSINSETFSAADWNALHQDRFTTVDAGVRFAELAGRFDTSVSFRYAKGTSEIEVDSLLSGSGPYPDLVTELVGGEIDVSYSLNDRVDLRLALRYEDYSSSDWALQGVEPATIPTVLTLGADPNDYDVILASFSVRYYFGRAAKAAASESETTDR
jgi:MtrB/PioB family decaheme-associated outer membrane protein